MELECFRIFDKTIAKIKAEIQGGKKVRVKKEKKRGV